MDLRQLELFVAVAEDGHFTRAAERIGVAQPAVSQQIGRLERELDARLFVRDRRGVRLTAAGEALLPRARATLAAAAGARSAVAAVRGVIEGRLAIGSIPEVREARLPRLLGEFRRAHPGVDLTLVEGSTDALGEALLAGGLDVAVLGTGPRQRPAAGLESILVHREPSLVAVPPGILLQRTDR